MNFLKEFANIVIKLLTMEQVLDILKYIIPSIIVFLTAYMLLKMFLNNDLKKRTQEYRMNNQKMITPIRLQAYERVTLFLERIAPDSLIMRIQKPGMTAGQLQSQVIASIRSEFEHNLSQQVYMSSAAWEVVRNAKENTVQLIKAAATGIDKEQPAMILSTKILETVVKMGTSPTRIAIDFLKKELEQIM